MKVGALVTTLKDVLNMAFLELSEKGSPLEVTRPNGEEYVFEYGKKTSVLFHHAVSMIGREEFKVGFDASDKDAVASASDNIVNILKAEFGVVGTREDLIKKMFPTQKTRKPKVVKKAVAPVKATPTKVTSPVKKSPSKVDKDNTISSE